MAQLSKGTLGKPQSASIEKMPVESSYIQFAEYDAASLRLTMTFKNGEQIVHMFVYPQTWQQFKESPSKGRAYNQLIKGKSPSSTILSKKIGRKKYGVVPKKGRS